MADTKDWANIRIEESVRDDAREDARTYTEIMRAGLNADGGDGDGGGTTPTVEDVQEAFGLPEEAIPDDLAERLDRIEAAATAAEDSAGSVETALEREGIGR